MKIKLIRIIRWVLIVLCTFVLGYIVYHWVAGTIRSLRSIDFGVDGILPLFLTTALAVFISALPAITLHSLITKRLYGLTCVIGLFMVLAAFYLTAILPTKFGLFRLLDGLFSSKFLPMGPVLGLMISVLLLVLPYWLVFRLIRLTTQWAYPKLFKPLEPLL